MSRLLRHPIAVITAGLIAFILGYLCIISFFPSLNTTSIIDSLEPPLLTNTDRGTVAEIAATPPEPPKQKLLTYLQIISGCGTVVSETCAHAYATTSTNTPPLAQLRKGMILEVESTIAQENGTWFRVVFNETLRYPERLSSAWYVPSEGVRIFERGGPIDLATTTEASTTKKIIVDRSEQILYAYDGETVFMEQQISTGLELTPTPRGTFTIYRKTPSRYMQGPIPGISTQYYDLPGVPWNLYFSKEGAVIHGVYWHDQFGKRWSHGCVNVPYDKAEQLYDWADLGTQVLVRD